MKLTLSYVPNMEHFLNAVNKCSGHVFLELRDQSYLNMKNNGEGKSFLESMGSRVNGLRVITEIEKDAIMLLESLLGS